jgi:type IV secretion system protein TrbG
MKPLLHMYVRASLLLAPMLMLTACATPPEPPPVISLDEPIAVVPIPELAAPAAPAPEIQIVEVPTPLPLPEQLKPLTIEPTPVPEMADERARVTQANAQARVAPTREGYVNAIQVWPFAEGALYQVYASPGRVTLIALQAGEELVSVSAGDTVRWIVGDTASGAGAEQRVSLLVKPTRSGLKTNLVVTTNRRTYLLELSSTAQTWMASVSWDYPTDRLHALQKKAAQAQAAAPVESGLALEQLRFRYAIKGDQPAWRPLRAFDDGQRVYIQFPAGIAQGELPPLFVVGPQGSGELVNHRYRAPYYVVDRLFGAAELRLGADKAAVVRIERTDGVRVDTGSAARAAADAQQPGALRVPGDTR